MLTTLPHGIGTSAASIDPDKIEISCDSINCEKASVEIVPPAVAGSILHLVDASGSLEMEKDESCPRCPVDPARKRVAALRNSVPALNVPRVRTSVAQFNGALAPSAGFATTSTILPFGTHTVDSVAALEQLESSGGTPLWDAIVESVAALAADMGSASASTTPQPGQARELVILSDGRDTASEKNIQDAALAVRANAVRPIVIGLGTERNIDGIQMADEFALNDLRIFSEEANALPVIQTTPDELETTYATVNQLVRNGFIIITFRVLPPVPIGTAITGRVVLASGESMPFGFTPAASAPTRSQTEWSNYRTVVQHGGEVDWDGDGLVDMAVSINNNTRTTQLFVDDALYETQTVFTDGRITAIGDHDLDATTDYYLEQYTHDGSTIVTIQFDQDHDGLLEHRTQRIFTSDGKLRETQEIRGSDGTITLLSSYDAPIRSPQFEGNCGLLRADDPCSPCYGNRLQGFPGSGYKERCQEAGYENNPYEPIDGDRQTVEPGGVIIISEAPGMMGGGRCTREQAAKLGRLLRDPNFTSKLNCLAKMDPALSKAVRDQIAMGRTLIACGDSCPCHGAATVSSSTGNEPVDDAMINMNMGASDDVALLSVLLHEFIHAAGVHHETPDGDGGRDKTYACVEACTGGCGVANPKLSDACARCVPKENKRMCGTRVVSREVLNAEHPEICNHEGSQLSEPCANASYLVWETCDREIISVGQFMCCWTCRHDSDNMPLALLCDPNADIDVSEDDCQNAPPQCP